MALEGWEGSWLLQKVVKSFDVGKDDEWIMYKIRMVATSLFLDPIFKTNFQYILKSILNAAHLHSSPILAVTRFLCTEPDLQGKLLRELLEAFIHPKV